MITREQAINIAKTQVEKAQDSDASSSVVLLLENTIEESFGWIFFYQSKEYLETGVLSSMLAGNAPFIVDKHNGSVHYTGTAEPLEVYIERYKPAVNE